MKYYSDKPITTPNKDVLGRYAFSENLGHTLYSFPSKEGLVVGLYGNWGSGKTSVINMTLHTIKTLSENDNNPPVTFVFSPWTYSDKDDLIFRFFQCLYYEINDKAQNKDDLKKEVGQALIDYADAFEAFSAIPIIGDAVAALTKTVANNEGKHLLQEKKLEDYRNELEKSLLKLDRKIIVVIDDLDRLSEKQIRDVFHLVKQVADFPNVIYVLAMDKRIVSKALEKVQKLDGNEYLSKIIQIPFEIPPIRKERIREYLINEIYEIVKNDVSFDERFSREMEVYYSSCIVPYVRTLRDIKRLINVFEFKYSFLSTDIYWKDLLILTTLALFDTNLYYWIIRNKDILLTNLFTAPNEKQREAKKFFDSESEILKYDLTNSTNPISLLFPNIIVTLSDSYDFVPIDYKGKIKRICHADYFNLYFSLDLNDLIISDAEIIKCFEVYSINQIVELFKKLNENEYLYTLLERILLPESSPLSYRIDNHVTELTSDRLQVIGEAILTVMDNLPNEFENLELENKGNHHIYDINNIFINIVLGIFSNLQDDNELLPFVYQIIDNRDMYEINNLCYFLLKNMSYYAFKEHSEPTEELKKYNFLRFIEFEKIFNKLKNRIINETKELSFSADIKKTEHLVTFLSNYDRHFVLDLISNGYLV